MVKWPEELRKCQNLKTIQLIYTNTGRIPTWTKEFKNLETIQIESKYAKTGPRIIAWYVRISQFTTASLTEYELL
ncbi:hypothetical protein PC117_g10694 [Phytophthora cactorum]|nr:hypothetical protein PC117_g10694 [Phytophthora cactorum]